MSSLPIYCRYTLERQTRTDYQYSNSSNPVLGRALCARYRCGVSDEQQHLRGHVEWGGEDAEHEDFLVADREGLASLKAAIDLALEKGECETHDFADFVGIRIMDSGYFTNRSSEEDPWWVGPLIWMGCLSVVGLVLLGAFTLISALIHWMGP